MAMSTREWTPSSCIEQIRARRPKRCIATRQSRVELRPRGHAAVLVALFSDEAGVLRVVLTQRSLSLKSHPGEIAFPGGKLDHGENVREAAFRECHEEIGLDMHAHIEDGRAEVLAVLDPVLSKHLLSVTPVVVYLKDVRALSDLNISLSQDEVSACFTAPIDLFLKDDGYDCQDVELLGYDVRVHGWMYSARDAVAEGSSVDSGYRIWGLTAWIMIDIAMLATRVSPAFALRSDGGLSLGDFVPEWTEST